MNTMDDDLLHESLSAVADGRATPADWARVNAAWDRDPALRERWALWHAAGDGLRSADLPPRHREPQALLDALHAQMAAPAVPRTRRGEWLAPLAVAASFVVVAVGWGALRLPAPDAGPTRASAPVAPAHAQALTGTSFAQAATGRALPVPGPAQIMETAPEIAEWPQGLAQPEAAASRP